MTYRAWSPLAVALLLACGASARAKDDADPVLRRLQAIDLAPGVEHRAVVLHPLYALPAPALVPPDERASLGGLAAPELVAFGKVERAAKPRSEVLNFGATPAAFYPGDVLRTDAADYAVAKDAVVPQGTPVEVSLVRISHETAPDPKAIEPRMLGPVLPSALRYLILSEESGAAVREAVSKWIDMAGVETSRRSPVELAAAQVLAKRVEDYKKSFSGLTKRAAPAGRELVGVALLIDGGLASYEIFADGRQFADAWPRLLEAVAVEASVFELKKGTIEADMVDPADPDRFLSAVKERLVAVYAARTTETKASGTGRRFALSTSGMAGDALVLGEDRVVHFVLATDPAQRGKKTSDDDLNAAQRRLRQTEEERRRGERKASGDPPIPPAPTPPPPPPVGPEK
jgi:hypothetical protein